MPSIFRDPKLFPPGSRRKHSTPALTKTRDAFLSQRFSSFSCFLHLPICPPVTRAESLLFPPVTDVTFCHVEPGPCPHWTASPESNRSRSFPHLWGCNMSPQPLHAGDNFWEQRPGRWQEAGGYFMPAVKKPPCKQPGGTSSEGFTLETPQLYREVMIPEAQGGV